MSALQPRNVRTRLTIWYVTVLAGVLLLYVAGASALVFFQLRSELDRFGIDDLETVEGLLSFGSDGKVSLHSEYHDHPYTANMQDRMLEVWSGDGALLYRNELLGSRDLGGKPEPAEGADGYSDPVHPHVRRNARSHRQQKASPARATHADPRRLQRRAPVAAFLADRHRHDCGPSAGAGARGSRRLFSGETITQSDRAHGAPRE